MSDHHRSSYLNDHMAGSVAALELLEHLEKHADALLANFAAELRADIVKDRDELEALMDRLQITMSRPRKLVAWMTEKLTELKLRLDDLQDTPFRHLEIFDALSIGIEGKRLLWRALSAAAESMPELGGIDYENLERRAEEQRHRVETVRLEAAKAALGSAPADHLA